MKAVICQTLEQFEAAGPGAIQRVDNGIFLKCPGCGNSSFMRVYSPTEDKPPSPSWLMTEFSQAISLHPSINCIGCCGWHGWLKLGEYKT